MATTSPLGVEIPTRQWYRSRRSPLPGTAGNKKTLAACSPPAHFERFRLEQADVDGDRLAARGDRERLVQRHEALAGDGDRDALARLQRARRLREADAAEQLGRRRDG